MMSTSRPVALVRAAHPRHALVTALVLAGAAAASGRELREVGAVAATVLVGQAILGWTDDLGDREADVRHAPHRPLAARRVQPDTVWFLVICAVLLVVPASIFHGPRAGGAYLASLAVAGVGNRLLHATPLSFLPWAASFALYPAFLAYGGWDGVGTTTPPTLTMTLLAAGLGVVVHVLIALPGLVADHGEGERSLPLVIALRIGTPRLLVVTAALLVVVVAAILMSGRSTGLT